MKRFYMEWIILLVEAITLLLADNPTEVQTPSNTCKNPLEEASLDATLTRCLQKIASDSYCGGSYDLQCLCDSDHFVYSTLYVKTYAKCYKKLSSDLHYKFSTYFQNLCKNPPPPINNCAQLNTPLPPILCTDPFKGMDWGDELLKCLENAAHQSRCKPSNEANCLCDSQSFWSGVNKCLQTEDLSKLAMTQEFRKSLCHDPWSLPGCSNSEDLSKCPNLFKEAGLSSALGSCLKKISKQTRCLGPVDPVCLCDSKIFMTLASHTGPSCLKSLHPHYLTEYHTYMEALCNEPTSPKGCISKYEPDNNPIICYDPYKSLNLGDKLKKCLTGAIEDSLCKPPYHSECLCDSLSYLNKVDECLKNSDDEHKTLIKKFLTTMCNKPISLPGCVSRSELLHTCEDVFEKSSFSDKLKFCLREIAKSTRCGGSYDTKCLCDSIEYIDSTMYVHTYAKCFRMFTVNEHLRYSDFHNVMCQNHKPVSQACLHLQISHKKKVICQDINKDLGFKGKLAACIKDALNKTLCKAPYDAVCLSDSRSYWDAINICAITTTNEENKMIKDFREMMSKSPELLPGCRETITTESSISTPTSTLSISTFTQTQSTLVPPGAMIPLDGKSSSVHAGYTFYVLGILIIILL